MPRTSDPLQVNDLIFHISQWEAIYLDTAPACGEFVVLLEACVEVHIRHQRVIQQLRTKDLKSSYRDFFSQFGLLVLNFNRGFGRLIARSHHFVKIGVIFPDREAEPMLPIGSRPNQGSFMTLLDNILLLHTDTEGRVQWFDPRLLHYCKGS